MDDLQLIEELKNGNEACLKHLYKFLPDVKRFMLQNSGDEDDAKDYLQEAIIVFYNNVRSGKYTHANLKGYILTTVKYKWFDWLDKLKGPKKAPGITIPEGEEDKPVEIYKPDISLGEYLQQALNNLGERCRAVINATVYMKLSMEQVASDLGFPSAQAARQKKLMCLKELRGFVSYEDVINLT